MIIKVDETKVMIIWRERNNINTTINDKIIGQVEDFKYLGSVFENQGRQDMEVNEKKEISRQTKMKVKTFLLLKNVIKGSEMTKYLPINSGC